MARFDFEKALRRKVDRHGKLIERRNKRAKDGNGVVDRWENPVLTAAHAPLHWRYDLDPKRNPLLLERLGVNAAFNVGALEWEGKVCLVARVEGADRKSFFAVAESRNGVGIAVRGEVRVTTGSRLLVGDKVLRIEAA